MAFSEALDKVQWVLNSINIDKESPIKESIHQLNLRNVNGIYWDEKVLLQNFCKKYRFGPKFVTEFIKKNYDETNPIFNYLNPAHYTPNISRDEIANFSEQSRFPCPLSPMIDYGKFYSGCMRILDYNKLDDESWAQCLVRKQFSCSKIVCMLLMERLMKDLPRSCTEMFAALRVGKYEFAISNLLGDEGVSRPIDNFFRSMKRLNKSSELYRLILPHKNSMTPYTSSKYNVFKENGRLSEDFIQFLIKFVVFIYRHITPKSPQQQLLLFLHEEYSHWFYDGVGSIRKFSNPQILVKDHRFFTKSKCMKNKQTCNDSVGYSSDRPIILISKLFQDFKEGFTGEVDHISKRISSENMHLNSNINESGMEGNMFWRFDESDILPGVTNQFVTYSVVKPLRRMEKLFKSVIKDFASRQYGITSEYHSLEFYFGRKHINTLDSLMFSIPIPDGACKFYYNYQSSEMVYLNEQEVELERVYFPLIYIVTNQINLLFNYVFELKFREKIIKQFPILREFITEDYVEFCQHDIEALKIISKHQSLQKLLLYESKFVKKIPENRIVHFNGGKVKINLHGLENKSDRLNGCWMFFGVVEIDNSENVCLMAFDIITRYLKWSDVVHTSQIYPEEFYVHPIVGGLQIQ